jgi:5-(carboxyamino)imidazole ribonucleotide synthase
MSNGSTLGILGGGQLGMMSARAARGLDIKTIIYTPEENSPASKVADEAIVAAYDDHAALESFAARVDYISYEFENIPVETIRVLNRFKPVYPDETLLKITQDRLVEKQFLNDIGIPTARWAAVRSVDDVRTCLNEWGAARCILKTTRFGYDGKGQAFVKSPDDIDEAWKSLSSSVLIAESLVDFACEISVIVARDHAEKTVTYAPSINIHKNSILHNSISPSGLPSTIVEQAQEMVLKLAENVDLQGVLALELFVTQDGKLLANEIPPRTHNSGHWTIEACKVSQFENHVRAVCGMDVKPPEQRFKAEMFNLIGEDIHKMKGYVPSDKVFIHDYGKDEVRAGRKMGHVTVLSVL